MDFGICRFAVTAKLSQVQDGCERGRRAHCTATRGLLGSAPSAFGTIFNVLCDAELFARVGAPPVGGVAALARCAHMRCAHRASPETLRQRNFVEEITQAVADLAFGTVHCGHALI